MIALKQTPKDLCHQVMNGLKQTPKGLCHEVINGLKQTLKIIVIREWMV